MAFDDALPSSESNIATTPRPSPTTVAGIPEARANDNAIPELHARPSRGSNNSSIVPAPIAHHSATTAHRTANGTAHGTTHRIATISAGRIFVDVPSAATIIESDDDSDIPPLSGLHSKSQRKPDAADDTAKGDGRGAAACPTGRDGSTPKRGPLCFSPKTVGREARKNGADWQPETKIYTMCPMYEAAASGRMKS
mmetsp:Transcript_13852/g.39825  ORF Transcript_13852/g.39825 Transcript_13852/m.39825 type:complete len:196 (-) Transcript_13852:264-851(-)